MRLDMAADLGGPVRIRVFEQILWRTHAEQHFVSGREALPTLGHLQRVLVPHVEWRRAAGFDAAHRIEAWIARVGSKPSDQKALDVVRARDTGLVGAQCEQFFEVLMSPDRDARRADFVVVLGGRTWLPARLPVRWQTANHNGLDSLISRHPCAYKDVKR